VTTLMARGVFPDSHELSLGMPGMHGHWTAITALQQADLLITLGARFDDRVTGSLASFAPHARVIHVDVDPAEIGKNREPDVPIVGDCAIVIDQILGHLDAALADGAAKPDVNDWWRQLRTWQAEHPLRLEQEADGPLKPQTAIRSIGEKLAGRGIVVTGVGQHQMWASQHIRYERPRSWINSGGLGTMGFGLPAAIGAQVARPDVPTVVITGDASIQMNSQEMATAAEYAVPVKVVVMNNGYMGMVRQWQELFWDRRYSQVDMGSFPDFVKLAEAYGWTGMRLEDKTTLVDDLCRALATDGPVLVDVRVTREECVYPMIAPGAAAREMVG
jgi:acetolactate synthase I/II/III large subunit